MRDMIRKLIMQELRAIEEDALVDIGKDSHIRGGSIDTYDAMYEDETCSECGGAMYEGECSECGYSGSTMLKESGCGCGSCSTCNDTVYGLGATSMHIDFPKHGGIQHHGHNNYMAKPALYKVAKYSYKLLHMIPDGYELDDWQRTKIAQISDDISEVYHSLDYDFREDD